jgi:5-aminopentanamidase
VAAGASAGADVTVLPELATTGAAYRSAEEAAARAEPITGPAIERLRELSARLRLVLVAGFCETSGLDRPYDSAVVLDHGRLRGHHRKTHLWGREKIIFAAGRVAPPVVPTSVGRLGLVICYELEIPEVTRGLARVGAQIIVAPANWPDLPKPAGERPIEIAKAQSAAAANRVYVVVADCCGREREQSWTGGSVICDPGGYPLAGPRLGQPTLLTARVVPAEADDKSLGTYNDAFADLRPELYLANAGDPGFDRDPRMAAGGDAR